MNNLPQKAHFTGICGVATSALAIALKNRGVTVTGSDKGFFPPVSTELEKNNIPFYAGWHPEQMTAGGSPDIIIFGGSGTSPSNPELLFAKENNIPTTSFAEALAKYIIRKNSIVVTGTWGKTTSSALLSFILGKTGFNPSYFTGGLSMSHPTGMITNTDWSVVEGDEYQISIEDKRPKFSVYSPTHLLISSVSWDHADLYPTEENYFDTFKNLVSGIPAHGIIIYCIDNDGAKRLMRSASAKAKVITYGESPDADFRLHSIKYDRHGLRFEIDHKGENYKLKSPMLGRFNAENMTAAFAMAVSVGTEPEQVTRSIEQFKGIKRRFEKRLDGDITVLDCHAPTADKASSILKSVREVYDAKIIAVYEPNIGGRQRSSAGAYKDAFREADIVVIPRLTKLKVTSDRSEKPLEGQELADIISTSHTNTVFIEQDSELINYIRENATKGDVVVFCGSHGFRGMIEEAVTCLRRLSPS